LDLRAELSLHFERRRPSFVDDRKETTMSATTSTAHAPSRVWVLALTSVVSLMVALDTLVVSTALTTIRLDLGASIEELEWTVNAYNLSLAVLLLPAAALGDRFGRRRMFTAGLGVFVAASAACALAPDAGWLIAARAVQGAGAALAITLALVLVSAAYPPERRGGAIGILEGITGLAVVAGPVIGGAIADGLAWEWIFWVNVPIGLAAIPLVLARIEESYGSDTALDLGGVALVTGGALGIVWALVRGNSAGWGSLEVLAALVLGVALLIAFVAWELRAREPMLPMHFFRTRAFSSGNAGVFFLFAALFGAVFFLAQFLQTGLGEDPLGAGLRLVPWTATLFVVAPIAGVLADRIGERPLLVGGLTLQAVGLGWVALAAEPGLGYGELLAPLIVAGVGASMAIPPAASSVVGAVAHEAVGKAAGANSMLRELGGVFGIAILVSVFASAGGYASAQDFSDGFAPALGVAAGLSLVGALASLGVPGGGQAVATAPQPHPIPAPETEASAD
jgi:EmrB/QacA subfamily drug resistance transporter